MSKTENSSRRQFVKLAVGTLASIPVFAATMARADSASPMLDPNSGQASALSYVADTTKVDAAKHPNHAATQLCSNCALYSGAAGSEAGACAIFPGTQVAAKGWCAAYAPKPS